MIFAIGQPPLSSFATPEVINSEQFSVEPVRYKIKETRGCLYR